MVDWWGNVVSIIREVQITIVDVEVNPEWGIWIKDVVSGNGLEEIVKHTVKLRADISCCEIADETNHCGMCLGESEKLSAAAVAVPLW